jgi:predicted metalloprotease with PDZ domain
VNAYGVILNGAATFVTLADRQRRPHEVRLILPASWGDAATALPRAGAEPHRYLASDYDTLVDSPIVAGNLDRHAFDVAKSRHELVDVGERTGWDGARAARDLEPMVQSVRRLWGSLPFDHYLFLNVFRQGGGGLEHKDSTLLTANPKTAGEPAGYRRWLPFVTHEYLHAFNVKRLRPIELGPFDYEKEPVTKSLWISEGLTNYYAELMLARSGLRDEAAFLAATSAQIANLQKQPGRLLQTLEQSSLEVWSNSLSGVNPNEKTVSYYVKGHVLGFLLDARIRTATHGARSLDDVMRLAYRRYAGSRGFTPGEFESVAEKITRAPLGDWFARALRSTEELDYDEALDWYGLRFALADGGAPSWTLQVRKQQTPEQARRLRALLEAR